MSEFDQFADNYNQLLDQSITVSGESSQYFTDYKAKYLHRVLGEASTAKILDFGCGVGNLATAISHFLPNCRVHGFDVSEQSIRKVDSGLRERGKFSSQLNHLDSDYDLVVIANVLHHVAPAQRNNTVQGLAKHLATGGRMAVFEHNPMNPLTRLTVARCPFDEEAILLRPAEVARLFRNAGLKNLQRDYIVFFPRLLAALRPLEPHLAWLPMGAQYAFLARR